MRSELLAGTGKAINMDSRSSRVAACCTCVGRTVPRQIRMAERAFYGPAFGELYPRLSVERGRGGVGAACYGL